MAKPIPENARLGIRVDITLGMPRYDCRFHGICRLDIDEPHTRQPLLPECGRARGWLFQPYPGFCLVCFDARSMTAQSEAYHFGKTFFALSQEISATPALQAQCCSRLVFQKGCYRISRKGDYYSVLFKMKG
jgi:hypothetical protein